MYLLIWKRKKFLSLVGSAEKQSEHPLAQAIVEGIKEKSIGFKEISDFETYPWIWNQNDSRW